MLGDNIAALRKKQGLSQQELAERIHVVRQTVSKWEKNLSVPDADALVRLADALDATVPALLGEPEQPPQEPGDVAAALFRINEQLAAQNRRRRRLWQIVGWVLGLWIALHALLLALGYVLSADPATMHEQPAVEETVTILDGME